MATKEPTRISAAGERLARVITSFAGSPAAFATALVTVLVWAALGPFFDYSDSWQLFINTATTIVTFLMVFLIQQTQNKDSLAIQLKLNEMVAAMEGASNRIVNIEDLSEAELKKLQSHYRALSELAQRDGGLLESRSVDEPKTHRDDKGPRRRRSRRNRQGAANGASRLAPTQKDK